MPIYEYRCAACGFQKEYLQKMGDALLTDCPECATPSLRKMVTAAGFQLKGSGWYVTDFKNGSQAKSDASGKSAKKTEETSATTTDTKSEAQSADKSTVQADDKSASKADSKPAADIPAKKPDVAAAPSTSGTSPA